jgi:pimeloyl-ACP methyl ester carboxylesterase
MTESESFDLPVAGGQLRVGVWSGRSGTPTVIAAHGITANHVSFGEVANALAGDATLLAPDLRGRGRSNNVTGPFGITAHADDVIRLLDHAGIECGTLVGHSMGAWVVAYTAARYPDRVSSVVLVDGGLALAGTADLPVDDVLEAVLGPSMARLSMTFADGDAYRDFWRQHPAVGGDYWSDLVERYVDYDLVGEPPECRSSVSIEAVRADATEQLAVPAVRDAVEAVQCPVTLLFAPRGLLDGPPLYADASRDALRRSWPSVVEEVVVPDTNHFTIVLGSGAPAVADAIRRAVTR